MIDTLLKLVKVSRPISWPNTAYPFAAAYLLSGGALTPAFWIGTLFFLIPYNLLMYGINDVFDYESDMRNPRKGGMEGALEQKSFHPTILLASTVLSVPFIVFLLLTGSLPSNGLLFILLFFVVAYSIKGLRFKEIPILDSLTSSIHFVGPAVYALSLTNFSPTYIPFIVAFLMWGMASHAFGAVQDIIPDRSGKLSSVATVFGAKTTVRLVALLYLAASVLVALQGGFALIVAVIGIIYAANVAPYVSISDQQSPSTNRAWRKFIWLNLFAGFVITLVLIAIYGIGQ